METDYLNQWATEIQLMLRGLGYDAPHSGVACDRTKAVCREYQAATALPVTGTVDDATLNHIVRDYHHIDQ